MSPLPLALIIASNRKQMDYAFQLNQLLASPYLYQLILVNTYRIDYPAHPKLVQIQCMKSGVSRSRNLGIAIAVRQNDILSFTDDDCVIDKNWFRVIQQTFQEHPEIQLVFGQTKPFEPDLHPNETCPCTFSKNINRFSITTRPGRHWEQVGFSNNMAVKAEVFQKVNEFKEWLGPGSIGSNCEDGEFINRCLIEGYQVGYQPKMLVYHNKWLTKEDTLKQAWSYTCGEMACYGWFALHGKQFAQAIVVDNIKSSFHRFRKIIRAALIFNRLTIIYWIEFWNMLTAQLRGLVVAFLSIIFHF